MDNPIMLRDLLPVHVPSETFRKEDRDGEPVHRSFIKGNTTSASYNEIKLQHTIPVFVKDNEPAISHTDFIDAMYDAASFVYGDGSVSDPSIRLSHPILGRIPSAKNKPANELCEYEKTIHYERMMFVMDIPCNHDEVDGNHLSLTLGGVKAYNLDNLYNKKGADEHFKMFVGFKNSVCTNLCVTTDGLALDVKVKDPRQLRDAICELLSRYDAMRHLETMSKLSQFRISERQFAELVGRCRLYQYLSTKRRQDIAPMLFGDQQLNTVCRDYYRDQNFSCDDDGSINLWKVYNLFTGACKTTYIDQFLDRSANAFQIARELQYAVDGGNSWFLQ